VRVLTPLIGFLKDIGSRKWLLRLPRELPPGPSFPFTKTRLEALSDGVFSVALTILVVALTTPDIIKNISDGKFDDYSPTMWSFFMSFAVIGMYWVAHHNEMNLVHLPDRPFLWLNLIFLMCIVFIPFSAAFLAKNWSWEWTCYGSDCSKQRKPVFVYSCNLFLAGIMLQGLWYYARKCKHEGKKREGKKYPDWWLVKTTVPKWMEAETSKRNWIIPCASVVVSYISLVSPLGGEIAIIIVPVIYAFWTLWYPLRRSSWAERP
jgi:uncharacterized membrane protein